MKAWVCYGCYQKVEPNRRVTDPVSAAPMPCQAPGCKNITNAPRLVQWPDETADDTQSAPQE